MGAKAMQMKFIDKPLLQKKVNTVVQKYAISTNKASKGYRIADDYSVMTNSDHKLYAIKGKVDEANKILLAQKSKISLKKTNDFIRYYKNYQEVSRLYKIEPTHEDKKSGDNMELYSDCGESNAEVMGNHNRVAVHKDLDDLAKSTTSSGEGLDSEFKGSIKYKGYPTEMKIEMIQKIIYYVTKKNDSELQKGINNLYYNVKPIHEEMEKNIKSQLFEEKIYDNDLRKVSDLYVAWYNNIKSKDTDEILGINEYANPSVGQGYTISTGGKNIVNKRSWNFHWAGVIMTSNDNKDKVILENYANTDKKNTDWNFQIHGTVKKGQSFHEEHKDSNLHGDSPTTMVVQ
jgi:hypothetical protein